MYNKYIDTITSIQPHTAIVIYRLIYQRFVIYKTCQKYCTVLNIRKITFNSVLLKTCRPIFRFGLMWLYNLAPGDFIQHFSHYFNVQHIYTILSVKLPGRCVYIPYRTCATFYAYKSDISMQNVAVNRFPNHGVLKTHTPACLH